MCVGSPSKLAVHPGKYKVEIVSGDKSDKIASLQLGTGSIFSFAVYKTPNGTVKVHAIEDVKPNNVNLLWIMPQYVLVTVAELLVSIPALEFAYTQAPPTLKSLLQAYNLFTMAMGNIVVISCRAALCADAVGRVLYICLHDHSGVYCIRA